MSGAEPKRRGPPLLGEEIMRSITVRMSKAQRDKLARLGGATWMRQAVDDAPEPIVKRKK